MAPHAKSFAFYQHRPRIFADVLCQQLKCIVYFKNIISIDAHGINAISNAFICEAFTPELFTAWCRKSVTIIFDDKENRKIPHRSNINGLMKIALAGSAV